MIAFSFNDPAGRFNYTWREFTLRQLDAPVRLPGLRRRRHRCRIEIAALSSLVATALGTLIALALVRYRFAGRGRDQPPHLPAR